MPDILSKKQRSYCMSKIRGKNTKPEMIFRRSLWAQGLRYRLKSKLPGKPDIIFPSKKVAVFIDGCYWHKCPQHFQTPKTNTDFWLEKINGNACRDSNVNKKLCDMGWKVIRIWEHEIRENIDSCVKIIEGSLR